MSEPSVVEGFYIPKDATEAIYIEKTGGIGNEYSKSQKLTEITSDLSGTVTSIPIIRIQKAVIALGNVFYLFNKRTATLTEFTLNEPQLPNDTSLSVESTVLTETIVKGSWVIYTGDQIGSFISQSDTAIRLGVRGYVQAITGGGNPLLMSVEGEEIEPSDSTLQEQNVTDSGFDVTFSPAQFVREDVEWAFSTKGDQTAKNIHTESELALLKGEFFIKATAGGRLVSVRGDAKPRTGSVLELTADNLNINSVVTRINADASVQIKAPSVDIDGVLNVINAGGTVGIDGGVVQASSAVVVGTDNNVAALTGAHADIRIYAGSSDPNTAPFRVLQDGSAVATKFVQLSGETVGGTIEHFSLKDLTVTGTITNDNSDFTLDNNGYSVAQSVGLNISRSYALDEGNKGALYCTTGAAILDSIAGTDLLIRANGVDADLRLFGERNIELLADEIDIQSEKFNIPVMTETERDNLTSPKDGFVIINSTTNDFNFYVAGAWRNT